MPWHIVKPLAAGLLVGLLLGLPTAGPHVAPLRAALDVLGIQAECLKSGSFSKPLTGLSVQD